MRKQSIISSLLAVTMLFTAGCGNILPAGTVKEIPDRDSIELIQSTVAMPDVVTEAVTYRDIYVTDIYNGSVYPTVKEYSFPSAQTFKSFPKNLGDEVVPGDVLAYADDEKLLEQIEKYQERVDNLKEDYQEFVEDNTQTVADAKWWTEYYADILSDLEDTEPTDTTAADYAKRRAAWEAEYKKWKGNHDIQEYNAYVGEEEMRQRTELYQLDYAHYNGKLQELLAQHKDTRIIADVAGTIVAASGAGYLAKGTPVVAVSCEGEKYIKTGYIYKVDILYNATEIYAFVNGKKYELTYVNGDNENITTFIVHDESNELQSGDFANIVLVKKASRENVLTVASSAVYGTQAERYVYKVNGNKAEKTVVKCGSTDGMYTEIVEGLSEGDLVQMPRTLTDNPVNTQKLGVAAEVTTGFYRTAELEYKDQEVIKNTLTGVNVYFLEYLVDNDTYVKEGTPLVRIRVDGDPYVVIELEKEIQRDIERLVEDKIAAKPKDMTEEEAAAFEEQIAANREAIAEKQERLEELREAYSSTTFNAPADGYVDDLVRMQSETLLTANQILGKILCVGDIWLTTEDSSDRLRYGQSVTISVPVAGKWSDAVDYELKVGRLGNYGLSADLTSGNVERLIFTDEQAMLSFQENVNAIYEMGFSYGFRANANVLLMKDVLMVPKDAVVKKNNATYVNVVQDDGTIILKSFVGTRYNEEGDYWVIDGLTEGTTICWE